MSATADWTAEGAHQYSAHYGMIASAGDVNGDGYADVAVGEPDYDGDQWDEGRAYVYYGSAAGLSLTANWTAEGGQDGAKFGGFAGTAGDVNGDGYDDLVVGAPRYDNGQTDEGRVFVFYGSANGLSASADWMAESDQDTAYFGTAAGTAGDVNGDGYEDLVVGAFQYDSGQTDEGRVFVFYGSANGLSAIPNWTAESDQAGAYFGRSAATAGDVNGDGYSDVVIGAYGYDNGQDAEGRAYVYFGSPAGLSATANWITESNQAGAHFGHDVGTAGDVNGDGFADLAIGAIDYDHGQTNEGRGRAFVYYGSPAGLSITADWTAEGDQDQARFSYPVRTAGDVNGDGYADLAVGAPYYDNGQIDEGRAFVYFGSANGLNMTPNWTIESNQTDAVLYPVGTAGDVNGDGYGDLVVGDTNYSSVQWRDGRAFAYYGNRGGLSLRPQQRRSDDGAPIAYLGQSDQPDRFRLALLGRTPFGRGHVKLEWEVKPLGTLFDGTGLQRSAAWVDTGTAGAQLDELVNGLSADTLYHWRVRLLYHPATTPFQQYSRWLTVPWNGWNEARLRTGAATTGDLAGTAWYDVDGDGVQDAGELGLAGVTIKLFRTGLQIGQVATGGDGAFRILGLPAGAYTVIEVQPAWLRWSTTPDEVTVTVTRGQRAIVNFGDWNGRPTWLPLILR